MDSCKDPRLVGRACICTSLSVTLSGYTGIYIIGLYVCLSLVCVCLYTYIYIYMYTYFLSCLPYLFIYLIVYTKHRDK